MKTARWFVICGMVLFATLSVAPAHAQYVGGQPPHNGSVDNGQPSNEPPPSVLGENFNKPPVANVVPVVKHSSSGFPAGQVLGATAGIATLALLWFFFVWKRHKDDEDEDDVLSGLQGPAPST